MAAWIAWLLIAGGACAFADIGWMARVACGLGLAATLPAYRRLAGIGGGRMVESAGHDERGVYIMLANAPGRRLAVTAVQISRFGNRLWVFRFATGQGACFRLIDPRAQEPRALRRLIRRLAQAPGGAIQAPAGK